MDVLIVDDDPKIQRVFARLLEKSGFMVAAVDSGLAACAELQRRRYQSDRLRRSDAFPGREAALHRAGSPPPVTRSTGRVCHGIRTGRRLLAKPVKFEQLVHVVREIANSAGGS